MKRNKIGDVFEIHLDGFNRYIQFLGKDKNCLDGDIVRCFRYKGLGAPEDLRGSLLSSGVLFITHTYINVGKKVGAWTFVGHFALESEFEMPHFRATDDFEPDIGVSDKWYVWKPNEEVEFVGRMNERLRAFPYGALLQPHAIREWAQTSKSHFCRPD